MKKLLMILSLLSVLTFSVTAAEKTATNTKKNEAKWTDWSYVNVPVLKVLDGKDGYVVLYQKNRAGVATTVIPKKWTEGTPDNPRKLKLRQIKNPNSAYMTVVKNGSDFVRVILNVPMSKSNSLWGVVSNGVQLDGVDKDTLEELDI